MGYINLTSRWLRSKVKYIDRSDTCEEIIAELEEVNDELDDLGIPFVYTDDKAYISKLKLDAVPMIGMFRNGDLLQFDGSIENKMAVLKFATDLDNLLLPGKIEEVSVPLLEHVLQERDHLFAFLYDEDDGRWGISLICVSVRFGFHFSSSISN